MRQIKLILPRLRWFHTRLKISLKTAKILFNRTGLDDLRKEYHTAFLASERTAKNAPDTIKMQGKVELLDELIKL